MNTRCLYCIICSLYSNIQNKFIQDISYVLKFTGIRDKVGLHIFADLVYLIHYNVHYI